MLLTTCWIPSAFVILISFGDLIPLTLLKLGSLTKGSRLFCRIQSTKRGQRLKEAPTCMLYSHVSKLIKKKLNSEGLDPSLYSLHILRSGGALPAAALEIPVHLFQRQRGWRSAQAKKKTFPGLTGLLAATFEEDSWLRLKTVC